MGRKERERKARRKAEQDAAEAAQRAVEASGTLAGSLPDPLLDKAEQELTAVAGDHWASRPGGKGEAENARLIRQAQRWHTAADAETFDSADPRKLTARDVAVLATRRGMLAADARVVPSHVANLIRMERQNQADDHQYDPFLVPPPNAGAPAAAEGQAGQVIGQQINFYIPQNGRSFEPPAAVVIEQPPPTNGHASNGHAPG